MLGGRANFKKGHGKDNYDTAVSDGSWRWPLMIWCHLNTTSFGGLGYTIYSGGRMAIARQLPDAHTGICLWGWKTRKAGKTCVAATYSVLHGKVDLVSSRHLGIGRLIRHSNGVR